MVWLRAGGGIVVFGAALACSGVAQAQTAPTGSDRFSGTVHATATYDSNVAGGNGAVASLRRVDPHDVVYDLGTTFIFQLPSSRETLFLSGSADVLRHQRNSILDAENYAVSAGGGAHVGACGGTLVASYSHRQSLIEDIALAVANNINEQESVNAGVSCGRGRITGGVQGGYTRSSNSATVEGFITSETTSASVFTGYKNKVIGDFTVAALYSKVNYADGPAIGTQGLRGFEQYGGNLTYSRKIGFRLNGTAGISYQSLKATGSGPSAGVNTSNFGSNVALNYRVSPRLALTLAYVLANDASPTLNANYVRNESVRLAGDYKLNSRISTHLSASQSRQDYRGGLATSFVQLRRSDETSISGGAAVKVGRKISVTFDATHIDRKADVPEFSYGSDQVSIGITSSF